jgi:hypothetical protein
MPFDLEVTTHTFTKTDRGGVQTVVADDPGDEEQIELVRDHLRYERDQFAAGNFTDPARIHGMDMPGVAELSAGYADITVTYTEVPSGAQLTYTTNEAELVTAVHAWFDRQVMDHGADAHEGDDVALQHAVGTPAPGGLQARCRSDQRRRELALGAGAHSEGLEPPTF